MSPGDLEFVQLVVSWVVSVAGAAVVIVRDERRLAGPALERAWPASSRDAAIYAFSPFSVLVHFLRTRRSARGAALGLGWLGAILLVDNALQWVAAAAIRGCGL